jgi:hypothetical protein
MPRTQKHDPEILHAALVGLQHALGAIEARIADLRSRLGGQPASRKSAAPAPADGRKKRTMSAAARKRIGLAQKKRWAAFNAAKAAPAAPKPSKRKLSAEGRARIIAATKKRWAAFRKSQAAPKAVAKKPVKRVAKKAAPAVAPPAVAAAAPE